MLVQRGITAQDPELCEGLYVGVGDYGDAHPAIKCKERRLTPRFGFCRVRHKPCRFTGFRGKGQENVLQTALNLQVGMGSQRVIQLDLTRQQLLMCVSTILTRPSIC